MNKFIMVLMLLVLVGCSDKNAGTKLDEPDNTMPTVEENIETADEIEETDAGMGKEGEEETETDFLTKKYFEQLKSGIMPDSAIQFTNKVGDIKTKLGEPNEEIPYQGAIFFVYDKFSYAVPFDGGDDDDIILISNRFDKTVTAKQLIDVWGEPTEQGELTEYNPGTFSYSYLFENHIINFQSVGGLEAEVNAVSLQQK
jgi:hypothetical protein